jgi:hypothetical protein
MINFWQWVQSRQDARQWSEDELACAELAWKEAIKLSKEREDGASVCAKCGMVCADNGGCYCPSVVA